MAIKQSFVVQRICIAVAVLVFLSSFIIAYMNTAKVEGKKIDMIFFLSYIILNVQDDFPQITNSSTIFKPEFILLVNNHSLIKKKFKLFLLFIVASRKNVNHILKKFIRISRKIINLL